MAAGLRWRLLVLAWIMSLAPRHVASLDLAGKDLPVPPVPQHGDAVMEAPLEVSPTLDAATLTISERLARDSSHTGLVAKNLLHVQERIDSVEREVLGKVFDMETLRNFLGSHRSAMDSSTNLQAEISAASTKVDAMTAELQKVRKIITEDEARHLKRMAELRALLAEGDAEIKRIGMTKHVFPGPVPAPYSAPAPAPARAEKGLEKQERDLEQVDAGLDKANKALRGQTANEAAAASAARMDLQAAKAALARHQRDVKNLEAEILKQHAYSDDCHQRAEGLRQRLAAEERRLSAERNRLADVERQRHEALESLIQSNRQLQTRLLKGRANLATIQTQVVATKDRHTALQSEGEVQFGMLRKTLGMRRQEADAAEIELAARLNATRNAEEKLKQSQGEMGRLQGILLSGRLAEMRRNNTQSKADLTQTHYSLQESQTALVKAATKIAEANETLQALRNATAESAEDARKAARESLAQVAAAKRKDDEATAKAESATMEAEASALTDCVAVWDELHKPVFEELEKCEQLKRDFQTKNAQVATLSSTVQGHEVSEEDHQQ